MKLTQIFPEEEKQILNQDEANKLNNVQKKTAKLFPREQLIDNDAKLDLGGSYQRMIYKMGECCGFCKTVCPCNCFVDYPYVQIDQGYVGLYLRFGKYVKTVPPGLQYINPCTDQMCKVDCKLQMLDCTKQWVLTKDNLSINVDATVYFRIKEAKKTIFYVNNINQSVNQLTLATIKNVSGQYTFQEMLEQRQEMQQFIQEFIDQNADDWVSYFINQGVDIENVIITDIRLNDRMKETLAAAATEIRQAQAKVIQAEANVKAAQLMKEAAALLESKVAMQIRYLQTINNIGDSSSTKIVLM